MYLMGSTRCGISAKQIQRETGVTYKTAWRMFKHIRTLLAEDLRLEGHQVEMDESYFGAKRKRGTPKCRPSPANTSKTCVVGIAEREGRGRVYATVANDATKKTLHGIAAERIMPEFTIFADEYYSYNGLDQQGGFLRRRPDRFI
jgi:transposase-like protein